MAGTAASRTVFKIRPVGDTDPHVAIQCDMNALTYDSNVSIAEQATFCRTDKDYGEPNGSISGGGNYTGDVAGAYTIMKAAQRAKEKVEYLYGPEGDDNGSPGLSGIMIVGRVQIGAQVGQLVNFTFEGGIDGDDHDFTWPA